MKNDVPITNGVVIPDHEIEVTASRAGGPGGQHVNKSSTRITVRWNVKTTTALDEVQKERVMKNLQARLTSDGDLIVSNSSTRSQDQNKKMALLNLSQAVRKALYVPKQRMKTRASKATKEARLHEKSHRGAIKKMRSKKFQED